jgi:choline dehydrogenase-like flavoprotein
MERYRAANAGEAIFDEAGLREFLERLRTNFNSVAHHLGTTRMSASPEDGVVDADCKAHGITNLYIAGGSVFPTGGHANPTLVIVALALRLGDLLRAS